MPPRPPPIFPIRIVPSPMWLALPPRHYFSNAILICTANFTNISMSSWTWQKLWNLLTINFKYKYFHNFGHGFIFKCIYLHDWKYEKWLLKNVFVKLAHPWHDLILIHYVEQPPNKFSPICHEKLLKKGPSILYGGHYALAPLENHVAVYAPSIFARKCRLRLVNILILAKKREQQNRSVVWGII